ncbi:MAG: GNAT family N-acetyltransferase, partial [Xenococcus sp. (in: cyanobacteria)]
YYPVVGLGRVRHLYVLSSKRRQGIGSQLLRQIIQQAKQNFDLLNLRTHNPEESLFYLSQGFQRSYERPECTHILELTNS